MIYKPLLVLLLLCCISTAAVWAGPAYPKGKLITQPDGSTIMLYGHGNEYCHYLTNESGERVVMGSDGFYRVTDEKPMMTVGGKRLLSRQPSEGEQQMVRRNMPRRKAEGEAPNYRGLVILVEFSDRSFRLDADQTRELYDGMLNQKGYTGYTDPMYGKQECTGSVRDYFLDNSYGQFDPQFDIVGPIKVNHKATYMNTVDNTYILTEEILEQVKDQVDFSLYDGNGDGDVDMFYILYAGYSSMYEGNDERLVWPHATTMIDYTGEEPDIIYNGVRMARFAVSTELYGWQSYGDKMHDGIGTIVHEFSHVLGFQDHYDTYSGYQESPCSWDVMDTGNYSDDYNRTPCAYNSYEKATAGFITPLDLSNMDEESVTLHSNETSTDAAIIHSMQDHVHFFMENRQPDKWDKNLIHHGMLVWRVDSVHPENWEQNLVNATTRACFRLVRAKGTQGSFFTGVVDTKEDPFPGTMNVTTLDNDWRDADLVSYDQYGSPVGLYEIAENDGVISMIVRKDPLIDDRPISNTLPKKFYGTAERLVGDDEWEPVEWTLTHKTVQLNGEEAEQIYNLLPNNIGVEQSGSTVSGQFYTYYYYTNYENITINATRLWVGAENGIWIANVSDIDAGGSGTILMGINRHGIPYLHDADAQLGLLSLKPGAYVAKESNVLDRLDIYRNVQYWETKPDTQGIDEVQTPKSEVRKVLRNGQLLILRNGKMYNINGTVLQ